MLRVASTSSYPHRAFLGLRAQPARLTPGGDPVRPEPPLGPATAGMDVVAPRRRGYSLSSAKGEAPGLTPCGLWTPEAVTRSGSPARPGTQGQPRALAPELLEGGPARRFMATAGPLRTERVSVLYQPNSGVEDLTRAGEEARVGGGAERHPDPPGPGLDLQLQLCQPCALVPTACGALAPRSWSFWWVGVALGCAGRTLA